MPIHQGPIPQRKYHRLAIEWDGGAVKIGRVQFHKQQLFVQLVDQPRTDGALFKGEIEVGVIQKTFNYSKIGYATSHLVKYSHAANGNCHFSETEKIDGRKVFTQAMRLDAGKGHFLSIVLGGLERFSRVVPADQNQLVTVCSFDSAQPPPVVYLACHWGQPEDIDSSVPFNNPIGPLDNLGSQGYGVAVAPPPDSPLAGRILVVQPVSRSVELSMGSKPFQSALIAGFTRVPDSQAQSFIALTYPAISAASMPSADIVP
jgi:hypothetical protein